MRFRGVYCAIFACLAAFVGPAAAQEAGEAARRIVTVEDGDYFGFDLETLRDVELADCEQACLADRGCGAFTYNTRARWCFLKSEAGELRSFPGAVAGQVVESAAVVQLPPAELGFVPDWIAEEASRLASELRAAPAGAGSVPELREAAEASMAQGDAAAAAELYAAAIARAPGDADLWLDYAIAALSVRSEDYSERTRYQNAALGAAIETVQAAADPAGRARGYAVLARALEARSNYRPALEAYKQSLALVDDADVRRTYEALREQHGFRIVDYTVDSDAAAPRICIQFSEDLAKGRVSYAPYVTLDGAPAPGLDASGQELCVTGVRHGERYRLTVRAGLPAELGETIREAADLDVYVRDRGPAVRFSGSDFVLPRVAARGIPVTSVNTEELVLDLYRVPARTLSQIFDDNAFLNPLAGYSAERLSEEMGEKLWTGRLDVRQDLNREVVTAIPLDEALPRREPGVYALTARPVEVSGDEWTDRATQWFVVTDTGLATLTGEDGLSVFARSLDSAAPLPGVALTLIARNNEVLGRATTDAQGRARFDPGLVRGTGGMAPGHLTAEGEAGDFVFLDLTRGGFDLSDRGVDGRPAPGALDPFLYTDRGVYRPGETVHLGVLLRDDAARAVPDLPLTLVLRRPDGVEERRVTSREDRAGGRVVDLLLAGNAMRGRWRIAAHAEPDGPAIAELAFLVEDFVPDRLEFALTADAQAVPADGPLGVGVAGEFLYGAPASDLAIEGEIVATPVRALPGHPGYVFGMDEEEVQPVRAPLRDLPRTDGTGAARFEVRLPELPASTRPFEASVQVRLREGGGRAVERSLTLPVAAAAPLIGVKPAFSGAAIGPGATARFDVVAVGPDGTRAALPGARWQLLKVERSFQHYRTDGQWRVEPVTHTSRVAGGTLDLAADAAASIEAPVESGRYRLEVSTDDPLGPLTSYAFTAGWYEASPDDDSPDALTVSLDRDRYALGDTATATIEAPFDGHAVVFVLADRLLDTREIEVVDGRATLELPVDEAWAPGAYVAAMLFRPMRTDDAAARRMPARAIGLGWVSVDMTGRTLDVAIEAPERARPNERLSVAVPVGGHAAGAPAYLTVAAVDVGILNLTAFTPPDPAAHFHGQRALGLEIRDLYGSLIDALVGESGRLRVGGGESGGGLLASPPAQDPVALFSGLVEVGADGRAEVAFDVPQFNGTLRLMAVAWTADSVGHATRDVVVRDPVVVTATAPRVLAPGDRSRLYLEFDNRDGPAGAYLVELATTGELDAAPLGSAGQLELPAGARRAASLDLTAREIGVGEITLRLSHADGLSLEQTLRVPVRPAAPRSTERRLVALPPDGTFRLDAELIRGLRPETAELTLSATGAGGIDVVGLMRDLEAYPYGCSEQIASRMFPVLALGDLMAGLRLPLGGAREDRDAAIREAIAGLVANQSASGSFGLWGVGSGDLWLDAYLAEFLTRARAAGFAVPDLALTLALDHLANELAYVGDVTDGGAATAYALHVLALNQRAAISDLRYFADARLDAFTTPLARAQLGAALALYGETDKARIAFASASDLLVGQSAQPEEAVLARTDYGSPLRDAAGLLALAAATPSETGFALEPVLGFVQREQATRQHLSTQEQAWLLRAADALIEDAARTVRLEIDGTPVEGAASRSYDAAALAAGPRTVRNLAARPTTIAVTATGVPLDTPPAEAEGFRIARDYYTLDGQVTEVSTVAQNTRLVVVLRVTKDAAWPAHVLVEDRLPGGFEIDNPNLLRSADLAAFSWLPADLAAVHAEFRDDRFVAAFDSGAEPGETFVAAYLVRAVAPGRYVHPGAHVEDMYRPYLFGRTSGGQVEVLAPLP